MSNKKVSRTTVLVDPLLWKRFRIRAMQDGVSASQMLEEMIKKKLSEK